MNKALLIFIVHSKVLVGWASVRMRAPGRAAQVGIALHQWSLFQKIENFKVSQMSTLNANNFKIWCFELHRASNARIDTAQHLKTTDFVITTKNVTQHTNLDATKDFSTDFSQQPLHRNLRRYFFLDLTEAHQDLREINWDLVTFVKFLPKYDFHFFTTTFPYPQ